MNIHGEPLRRLTGAIFAAAGCAEDEAARVARYLVEANMTGHDSHGVIRVPRYVGLLRDGGVVANQTIDVITENDVMAVVDGRFGFGQSIGEQAVDLGIDKARENRVSIMALRNSGHLGRIGDWAERAAAQDQISVHFVNTSGRGLLVAPFGAIERRMSTNPFAVGVPRPGQAPLILDFATSIVAEGKILVAINGGKPVPEGAFVAEDGTLTTDAEVIYGPLTSTQPTGTRTGTGAIRAMGEHKGSGLSIMCEILAGALTGGGCARPDQAQLANGMLSIYMDIAAFDAGDGFAAEVARYIDFAKSARPLAPDGDVLMPGEPEQRNREQRGAAGIPLQDSAWQSIVETAADVGLDRHAIDKLIA